MTAHLLWLTQLQLICTGQAFLRTPSWKQTVYSSTYSTGIYHSSSHTDGSCSKPDNRSSSDYCFANVMNSLRTADLCPVIQHRREMLRTICVAFSSMSAASDNVRLMYVAVHGLLQQSNRCFAIHPTQSLYSVPERVNFKLCFLKYWPHGLSRNSLLHF